MTVPSSGHATDVGHVRVVNEDALLDAPPLFVVADGMGGHAAGDAASALVVEELAALVAGADGPDGRAPDERALRDALTRADRRVRAISDASGRPLGAGTTVAAALLLDAEGEHPAWLVLWCGDSRVYRWAGGDLEQVSVDHSVVQELVDDGSLTPEEARRHPARNVITRAVGIGPGLRADAVRLPVRPGERLVVCSDGLTNEVDDEALAAALAAGTGAQASAAALVAAALESGGRDNVTVVVVDVPGDRAAAADGAGLG